MQIELYIKDCREKLLTAKELELEAARLRKFVQLSLSARAFDAKDNPKKYDPTEVSLIMAQVLYEN